MCMCVWVGVSLCVHVRVSACACVCMCFCVYARTSVCEREADRQLAYGGRDQGLTSELMLMVWNSISAKSGRVVNGPHWSRVGAPVVMG